jgi:hypothetical protein
MYSVASSQENCIQKGPVRAKTILLFRRKTRPRNQPNRNNGRQSDGEETNCKNLGIWLSIITTCTWLVFISYFTSVIHSENMRIEREIQKGESKIQIRDVYVSDYQKESLQGEYLTFVLDFYRYQKCTK